MGVIVSNLKSLGEEIKMSYRDEKYRKASNKVYQQISRKYLRKKIEKLSQNDKINFIINNHILPVLKPFLVDKKIPKNKRIEIIYKTTINENKPLYKTVIYLRHQIYNTGKIKNENFIMNYIFNNSEKRKSKPNVEYLIRLFECTAYQISSIHLLRWRFLPTEDSNKNHQE